MEVLAQFDPNVLFTSDTVPVVIMLLSAAPVVIIAIVASQWRKVRIAEAEAGIKLKMIERGFSADEIAKVLQTEMAGGKRHRPHRAAAPAGCCPSDFVKGGSPT